ncbi:hypothetical protein HDU93_004720, partial [Gonapodya sp. JEL0774]
MPIKIAIERPDSPEVMAMLDRLDDYLLPLCPIEFQFRLDVATLLKKDIFFTVAREEGTNEAVGCGGIYITPEYTEVKRVWVEPSRRGKGYAMQIMRYLEDLARSRGTKRLTIETGNNMDDALALYKKAG